MNPATPSGISRLPRYVLTAGRTEPGVPVRLESQVRAAPLLRAGAGTVFAGLPPEKQRLVVLCGGGELPVIELACRMALPPPLVAVMVADLLQDGVLSMAVPDGEGDRTALLDAVLVNLQLRWGVHAGARAS
ncbi:DUF742 domain-containing protein [Streptomyces tsukubensis]|uniref:DUF742 domain-containing protein n=1 Tax=Streptomyces tsukubensis TaxID=83656 RepID=UPI00344F7CBE